jgi:plasmid stabilization system protein ParE
MISVNISEAAQRDLDDFWTYIAQDSPRNADKFIDRIIDAAIKVLSVVPQGGGRGRSLAKAFEVFPLRAMLFSTGPQKPQSTSSASFTARAT